MKYVFIRSHRDFNVISNCFWSGWWRCYSTTIIRRYKTTEVIRSVGYVFTGQLNWTLLLIRSTNVSSLLNDNSIKYSLITLRWTSKKPAYRCVIHFSMKTALDRYVVDLGNCFVSSNLIENENRIDVRIFLVSEWSNEQDFLLLWFTSSNHTILMCVFVNWTFISSEVSRVSWDWIETISELVSISF